MAQLVECEAGDRMGRKATNQTKKTNHPVGHMFYLENIKNLLVLEP